jgi:hypothetical protein
VYLLVREVSCNRPSYSSSLQTAQRAGAKAVALWAPVVQVLSYGGFVSRERVGPCHAASELHTWQQQQQQLAW